MGVTAQEAAISAMVNWRASYMRRAFPISSGVILGFRPPLRPRAAASPAGVRSRMRAASYSAIRAHPEHEGAVRGGGVDQPVAQRPDPDPAGLQGGDDVDEVAQVAAEPVDPPDDQGVAGRRSARQAVHCGRSAFVPLARSVWTFRQSSVASAPSCLSLIHISEPTRLLST